MTVEKPDDAPDGFKTDTAHGKFDNSKPEDAPDGFKTESLK